MTLHRALSPRLGALLALSTALSLGAGLAAAQPTAERADALDAPRQDSPVRRVAAQVQAFYDQTDTLQARFRQLHYHRLYDRRQSASGRLVLDKPGRLRFDYEGGKVFVSDGRFLTAYEPGEEGAPGQYVKSPVGEDAIPGAFAFLTGEGRLDRDYTLRLLDADAWRWDGAVLELRPRRPDPQVRRVVLYVDGDPRRAGVVHRIFVQDHEGNRNLFAFHRMRFNRDVSEGRFAFQPPRGARRIQR